ncbi:hypothetical protein CDAR_377131 [Caerostris darwini]|uniref:Uncharacterized protein n=1 Tax=Caerostris darwini TaxID=1538125 RepID=A0AAV4UQX4_9ARAC|nr:hypothetical protein CDAR_377131 [Caerostris darwini]
MPSVVKLQLMMCASEELSSVDTVENRRFNMQLFKKKYYILKNPINKTNNLKKKPERKIRSKDPKLPPLRLTKYKTQKLATRKRDTHSRSQIPFPNPLSLALCIVRIYSLWGIDSLCQPHFRGSTSPTKYVIMPGKNMPSALKLQLVLCASEELSSGDTVETRRFNMELFASSTSNPSQLEVQ